MKKRSVVYFFILMFLFSVAGAQSVQEKKNETFVNTQWKGKKVAFLGDSMTQKRKSEVVVYWEYLAEMLGIEPLVYGISGHQWTGVYGQAKKLKEEKGLDVDAIFIFAGTNDYNHGIPLGNFFIESEKETNHNGNTVLRKLRTPVFADSTFCGRINMVMDFLKSNYPDQQIFILTPIHRGFAQFSERNIQPEECFANAQGLFLESYVNALKEASSIWAVPLINLYSASGLYPLQKEYSKYFEDQVTDMLHPNSEGNLRLAKTIQYQLLGLPSTFK